MASHSQHRGSSRYDNPYVGLPDTSEAFNETYKTEVADGLGRMGQGHPDRYRDIIVKYGRIEKVGISWEKIFLSGIIRQSLI